MHQTQFIHQSGGQKRLIELSPTLQQEALHPKERVQAHQRLAQVIRDNIGNAHFPKIGQMRRSNGR